MVSSEFLEFLSSRCSVREYGEIDLSPREEEYILNCAVTAPSAGNLEAWDVVVVRSREQKEALSEAAFDQPHVATASCLFVACANYVRSMSRYGERGILYAVQDTTIACSFMMLAAHALRVHSCWVGAFDEDVVRDILNLPGHIRPMAILCVGRGSPPGSLTPRMAASEHVHEEFW
ncbi:MAG TPA: nitroreductase [Methanolinea sp.]|nr:nitroreductase [Methanolinea sp.]